MPDHNNSFRDEDLEAGPQLIGGLKSLYSAAPEVPPEADRAILSAARRELRRRRTRVLVFRWTAVAAAAAGIMIVVSLFRAPAAAPIAGSHGQPALAREDLDRNGRVDILDAFALARRIETPGISPGEPPTPCVAGFGGREAGGTGPTTGVVGRVPDPARRSAAPSKEYDMNGDGAVDRRDVDTIALAAVSLEGKALQ